MSVASRAVGGEVAFLPPPAHGAEQLADPLAGRNAEGGHIATGERKYRWRPNTCEIKKLGEPASRHFPFRRLQQCYITIALGTQQIETSPLGLGLAARIQRPGRHKTMEPLTPGI